MNDLIEYIASWIVDDADAVRVTDQQRGDRVTVRLEVDESDMGRIIGREGRLAGAMRTLLSISGEIRDQRASLEIR